MFARFLDRLPLVGTRRALAGARLRLHAAREEIGALRVRVEAQARRLEIEKVRRRRLERRLAKASAREEAHGASASPDERPSPLVFDHIPKTAGSTFNRSYLRAALPPEELWLFAPREKNEGNRRQLLGLPAPRLQRIRVVAGHQTGELRADLPGARFVSVVRDPVARAISSYLHALYEPGGQKLWEDVRQEQPTLDEYARRLPANLQSRTLLGDDFEALDDEEMRRRLRERYALVGHTEAFDEFVFLVHRMEGLPLCLYNNRLVRQERRGFVPPAADVEMLRAREAADLRLHALVQEEFRARVAALPAEAREGLSRYLDALRAYRADTGGDVAQAVRLDADWDARIAGVSPG
jgi:hypothetical protein